MVVKNNNTSEKNPDLGTKKYFFDVVMQVNRCIDRFFDDDENYNWIPIRQKLDESYFTLDPDTQAELRDSYVAMARGIDGVVNIINDDALNRVFRGKGERREYENEANFYRLGFLRKDWDAFLDGSTDHAPGISFSGKLK